MAPKKNTKIIPPQDTLPKDLKDKLNDFMTLYYKPEKKDEQTYLDLFHTKFKSDTNSDFENFKYNIFKHGFNIKEIELILKEDITNFYTHISMLLKYQEAYNNFKTELDTDKPNVSENSAIMFSDVDPKTNKAKYNISLLQLQHNSGIDLQSVEIFIENTINTGFITKDIITLINNAIKHNPRTVTLQIILKIYKLTQKSVIKLEIQEIIKLLLNDILSICETINDYTVLRSLKHDPTGILLKRMPWQNNLGDANSSLTKSHYRKNEEDDIETEFDLKNGETYKLGRYNNDDNGKVITIPVFSTIYPHIESINHAILTIEDSVMNIQHIRSAINGTFIIRDNITIDLSYYLKITGKHELYHNDVICIGYPEIKVKYRDPKIEQYLSSLNDDDEKKNDDRYKKNDARYHVYIAKPTTLMLYGCIPCSVVDVYALINCLGSNREQFVECIRVDEYLSPLHFTHPENRDQPLRGGSRYITIGGRRRKIHIQKGKQYVNYKSELILVTKLKKLLKSEK